MTQHSSGYDPGQYPPFAVSVDLVVCSVIDDVFSVALIERGVEPYEGCWALPGGFVWAGTPRKPAESTEEAALRELREETGLDLRGGGHLEQLGTYSEPDRDPRMRVISVAYVAFVPSPGQVHAGTDAGSAAWIPVASALELPLAFDHNTILSEGVERVRAKLEYTTLATAFVSNRFTLTELRSVYESVWGVPLHAANFARKVLASDGFVEDTGERRSGPVGRPTRLFVPGPAQLISPPMMRT